GPRRGVAGAGAGPRGPPVRPPLHGRRRARAVRRAGRLAGHGPGLADALLAGRAAVFRAAVAAGPPRPVARVLVLRVQLPSVRAGPRAYGPAAARGGQRPGAAPVL